MRFSKFYPRKKLCKIRLFLGFSVYGFSIYLLRYYYKKIRFQKKIGDISADRFTLKTKNNKPHSHHSPNHQSRQLFLLVALIMLFEEYANFQHTFPQPQYLGAKFLLLDWIKQYIPRWITTVLDGFAGSQSVAFLFKQLWYKVLTNDFMKYNHQIWLALIQNTTETLTQEETQMLFDPVSTDWYTLMQEQFTDVFFLKEETQMLDCFRANVGKLSNKYKQALALSVMNRSLTRKTTMGHFAHLKAIEYANDPERIKRNASLIRPIKDIFLELVDSYNQAVFDNGQDNQSFHMNILDLMQKLNSQENDTKVDLVYFDPPYCDSHSDYQSFYHLLETFTQYRQDKEFINGTKRYHPKVFSWFDKKQDVIDSLHRLFSQSQHIPYRMISRNTRSYPAVDEFAEIIKIYKKNINIHYKSYENSRWGKGSVAGSQEVLFVAS